MLNLVKCEKMGFLRVSGGEKWPEVLKLVKKFYKKFSEEVK